ncbi:MAG: hypothetical protein RSB51_00345 [Clostridia bacterium]
MIKLIDDTLDAGKIPSNFDLDSGKKELSSIVLKTVDRGADYVIKSMPIPEQFKNILTDIKGSFLKDGFKNLVKVAVNSSIEEGLQMLGMKESDIKSLGDTKQIYKDGGLPFAIQGIIDCNQSETLDHRIVGDYVYVFYDRLKNYVLGNKFMEKIDNSVDRFENKADRFIEKCNSWYDAYKEKDMEKINEISDELNKNIGNVRNDSNCKIENGIIQNITKLCNEKEAFLSKTEFNICKSM